MIAIVLLTILSAVQGQTCAVSTDGNSCVFVPSASATTAAKCADHRVCNENRDQESCQARRTDNLDCTWLAESGHCVSHPAAICDMMDCFVDELYRDASYADQCADVDVDNCASTVLVEQVPSLAELGIVYGSNVALNNFDECFDITDTGATRNAAAGSSWLFCNEDMDDEDPCVDDNNFEVNVECRGEESCEEKTFKANVVCSGIDSCGEATFKPQESTHYVKCVGDSACEDVTGKERKDIKSADEDTYTYACMTEAEGVRDVCRGANFKDNTHCYGENACEDAEIDAKMVFCGDGPESCSGAEITAEVLECQADTSCAEAKLIVNKGTCGVSGACMDATINLGKGMGQGLDEPRVICDDVLSCQRATFNYMFPIIEGDESVQCNATESCLDATIKAEAHCAVEYSCEGAYIARDVICGHEDSCLNTHMTQGTICCGPGCLNANTLDDFAQPYADADDVGCHEDVKSMKTHPTYTTYECKRCGKETLIGWITDNKTNLVIAVIVCILVLLLILFAVGFVLRKMGILNICMKPSEEEVDAE